MTDYHELLRLRDENECVHRDILTQTLSDFEESYGRYRRNSFNRVMDAIMPTLGREIRKSNEQYRAIAMASTRTSLRNSARDLTRFPGLTTSQKVELGRYGIGTAWEGNVYLEEKR